MLDLLCWSVILGMPEKLQGLQLDFSISKCDRKKRPASFRSGNATLKVSAGSSKVLPMRYNEDLIGAHRTQLVETLSELLRS